MEDLTWRKSSYSSNGGECVEASSDDHGVNVRDTTDRAGGMLTVSASAWTAFTSEVKAGRQDIPAALHPSERHLRKGVLVCHSSERVSNTVRRCSWW